MTVLATEPIIGGKQLTDEELTDMVVLLILAGFHTTSGAFTALMVHMEEHPEVKQRLDENRDLIPPRSRRSSGSTPRPPPTRAWSPRTPSSAAWR